MKEMLGRRELFKPDEKVFKYRQSIHNTSFLSEYVFPSASHYPKSFNTKVQPLQIEVAPGELIKPVSRARKQEGSICPVTGEPAKYRDPLTGTPYANKEAFKIIREKFFQRDEEKLFVRL